MARPKGKVLRGDPLSHVTNPNHRLLLRDAFKGKLVAIELQEDLAVCRYRRGKFTTPEASWFSPKPYPSPADARCKLALPNSNMAEKMDRFKIPKRTIILWGKAASQVGVTGFGPYATGGGEQIYLPDPSKARRGRGGAES